MKVCFFSHGSGTNQDGASLSMLNVMQEMTTRDVDVIAIMAKDINLEAYKTNKRIKFYFFPTYDMRMNLSLVNSRTNLHFYIKNKLNGFKYVQLCNILKDENIDIIHINGLNNGIGALVARKFKIPYVWHIRQLLQEDLNQRLYNQKKVWPLVAEANSVIAISKAVKDKFEKEFHREIVVIYNGVPVDEYRVENHTILENEVVRLILPGRIVEGKGQLDAVKAVEHCVNVGLTNIFLYIVGHSQTEYAYVVKKYVVDKHLSQYVEFQDHNPDLRTLRGKCDIGLTCSKKEAFGRVTVENQMAGLLAIGANTGGTVEIIDDGVNGLLYEANNSKELACKITEVVNNRESSRWLAENGYRESQEKYSIERVVDRILIEYEKCFEI